MKIDRKDEKNKSYFPFQERVKFRTTLRDDYISFTETTACMVNLFALICTLLYTDIYLSTYTKNWGYLCTHTKNGGDSVKHRCD